MPTQAKAFQQLKEFWYKKLKKSGFKDIEPNDRHILNPSPHNISQDLYRGLSRDQVLISNQAKQDYYRLAGYFLHDHTFKTPREKAIWTLHAEGASVRETVNILRKDYRKSMHKSGIARTIIKLREIMFERYRGQDNE